MLAQIFGFVILSFILVVMYGIKFKLKDEVLPILGALVFMLLSKILRQLFNLNTIEVTLLSIFYLFLLALLLKIFVSNK
ncbi:hypothetical protein [Prevotella pallens]|jgi:hypothetical protein|uniref:hypothetical protein n=1 Tax=Prevotella pallens TaxID=60133 RepID=UPI00248FEE12|nr:hypothetical protein [Prevotella pallens]